MSHSRQYIILSTSVCIVCTAFNAYPGAAVSNTTSPAESATEPAAQTTVAKTTATPPISAYDGKRKVAKPTVPPPPVNAIVNSSLESDGSQFLLPFQGKIGSQPQPPAPTTSSNGVALAAISVSRVVPTDIDYGESDNQDSSVVPSTDRQVRSRQPKNTADRAYKPSNTQGTHDTASNTTTADDTKTAPGDAESEGVAPNSWPGRAAACIAHTGKQAAHKVAPKLFGSVSRDDQFGVRIDDLLACALARNTKMKNVNRSVAHFHSHKSKTFDGFKDSMDEAFDYKGSSRSMEAVDVILDRNVKAKSADSADYIKQRYVDQLHPKIVSKVMQIAMGMGFSDQVRGKEIVDSGVKGLSELVGEKQAKSTVAMLRDWTEHINIPEEIFQQQQWDVEVYRDKVNLSTKIAMNSDPVVNDMIKAVRRFDRNGPANKIYGATNLAANLTEVAAPGLIIPFGVEVLREGMVQANGGSEPKKLLRELYYDKRIESRYRTINEESQLAITNYQLAVARHNPTLLACAESVLSQLVGLECITDILDESIFHPQNKTENSQILQADKSVR